MVKKLQFGKNAEVLITPFGESRTDLLSFFYSGRRLKIDKGAKVLGSIVAADALVDLKKNARFKGSICAKEIKTGVGATFLHHTSTISLPKASLLTAEDEAADEVSLAAVPEEFGLGQNYPNPFNPSTTISFALPKASEVTIAIYNLRGQLVRTLVSQPYAAGRHKVVWDGKDVDDVRVASGVYVYRLEAKDFVATKKLTLMK